MTLKTHGYGRNGEAEEWVYDDSQVSDLATWMATGNMGEEIQKYRPDNGNTSGIRDLDVLRTYKWRHLLPNRI